MQKYTEDFGIVHDASTSTLFWATAVKHNNKLFHYYERFILENCFNFITIANNYWQQLFLLLRHRLMYRLLCFVQKISDYIVIASAILKFNHFRTFKSRINTPLSTFFGQSMLLLLLLIDIIMPSSALLKRCHNLNGNFSCIVRLFSSFTLIFFDGKFVADWPKPKSFAQSFFHPLFSHERESITIA